MKSREKIEFGDFQTPIALAQEICSLIVHRGIKPDVVMEPTVGRGSFLAAAATAFPRSSLYGWDINKAYLQEAADTLQTIGASSRANLTWLDFFSCDWESLFKGMEGDLIILGNPPWVTNSEIGAISGTNLPEKENFHGLRGISALTGKANFDISEWMLIRLLEAARGREITLAMLCKTSTARKFLRYAWQNDGRIADACLYRIDAAAHFGVAVDACLLFFRTGPTGPSEADVYASLSASEPTSRIALVGKELVADIKAYRALRHMEGLSPFRWRSGIKHDCAAIMELHPVVNGTIKNQLGENVDLEPDYLFPLLKCSDLANGRTAPKRLVLVTQRYVGDDTSAIAHKAPRTWKYLQSHASRFHARKSSIYRGRMSFCLFGIGPYAFAPWKVAISGLHRSLHFQLVGPCSGKTVFFDDACYYLSFENECDARLISEILNSAVCRRFISSLLFTDSKRPVTVELLQRLNLAAIAQEAGLGNRWHQLKCGIYEISSHVAQMVAQMELVMESHHE